MKQPPFLAYQVRLDLIHGLPHVYIRAVTVLELMRATKTARIQVGSGTTYALFSELRTDRRAAVDLAAEKLIASPAAGESAAAEVAGRAPRAPAAVCSPHNQKIDGHFRFRAHAGVTS